MDAADLQKQAKSAVQRVRAVRERLKKSPGLEVLAAVAAGFVVGVLLRAFEKGE